MIDNFLPVLITYNQSSELFASVVGAIAFSKLDYFSKIIAIQVFIALIVELIGLQIHAKSPENIWVYNVYMLLEFSLLIIAVGFIKENKQYFKGIILLLILYLTVWIIEIANSSLQTFAVKTYIFGAVFLLVSYCFVLYKSAGNYNPLLRQSNFWFAIGIILFFGCNIPFFSMHHYIANYSNPAQVNMFVLLMSLFAHIRYLCMAIGFIIVFGDMKRKKTIANG